MRLSRISPKSICLVLNIRLSRAINTHLKPRTSVHRTAFNAWPSYSAASETGVRYTLIAISARLRLSPLLLSALGDDERAIDDADEGGERTNEIVRAVWRRREG